MSMSFSTEKVLLQCMLGSLNDSNRNSNCDCLLSGGGPPLNTDIGGIGVRISFYLQSLFLALLSARSKSFNETSGALYTLVTTNIAMVVTSFILGFKSSPEISFHDATIAFYLLSLSWASIVFSIPSYNRFKKAKIMLIALTIGQSYFICAFALAVLLKAPEFGNTPLCNKHAVVIFFHQFRIVNRGRIAGIIAVPTIVVTYTLIIFTDYKLKLVKYILIWKGRESKEQASIGDMDPLHLNGRSRSARSQAVEQNEENGYNHTTDIDGKLIVQILVIFVVWSLAVLNTELLIKRNKFEGDGVGSSNWQFGQILPMFQIIIPLGSMIKEYVDLGLYKKHES